MSTFHSKHRTKIAEQILLAIKKFDTTNIQCFIVYGSTARGTATEHSDLDIQILVHVTTPKLVNYLSKLKATFEQKYDLEIALNLKTVSQYIENLMRNEPLYYFILVDGICLLNSTVFIGLKHFLKANPKPILKKLEKVHAKGIGIRSAAILTTHTPKIIEEFQSILLDYTSLDFIRNNSVKNYIDLLANTKGRDIAHKPIPLKEMEKCITQIKHFANSSFTLDLKNEFNLIDMLKMLNIILQESNPNVHE